MWVTRSGKIEKGEEKTNRLHTSLRGRGRAKGWGMVLSRSQRGKYLCGLLSTRHQLSVTIVKVIFPEAKTWADKER